MNTGFIVASADSAVSHIRLNGRYLLNTQVLAALQRGCGFRWSGHRPWFQQYIQAHWCTSHDWHWRIFSCTRLCDS